MDLSNLRPADGSKQSDNFRRGRGHGSGNGKTAGKGHKGQKARSGGTRPGFEGGQMPLYRRIPKRGFTNRNTKTIVGINVSALEVFENDTVVTVDTLIEQGIVTNPKDGVKILGNGELTKKLTVQADAFSPSRPFPRRRWRQFREVGCSSPMIIRKRVVLPVPLGPITPTIPAGGSEKFSPSYSTRSPKAFDTSCASITTSPRRGPFGMNISSFSS